MPRDELLWQCIHRLASVLEIKHAAITYLAAPLEYPQNIVREERSGKFYSPGMFICKNVFYFLSEHYGSRCDLGYNYLEYRLKEGTKNTWEILKITYNESREAITAQTKETFTSDHIFLRVGSIQSDDANITLEFFKSCIQTLQTYIDELQEHFNSVGNIRGVQRQATLRS